MKNFKIATILLVTGVISLVNCRKAPCEYDLIADVIPEEFCVVCQDPTFIFAGDSTSCEKITTQAAVLNGSQFTLEQGDQNSAYNKFGVNIYSVTAAQFPISSNASGGTMYDVNATALTPIHMNGFWQSTNALTGRLNQVGVWSPLIPAGEWIGFESCLDVPTTRKYYVGISADNRCRFKVNGVLIANLDNGNTFNFNYWHIVEVELQAGTNIIEMEGYNNGSDASFGAEIYDATLAEIQGWTTDAEVDAAAIFSTKDQIGQLTTIGELNGYSCPLGFAVDFCTGQTVPVCTLIEKGMVVPCP